MLEATQWFGVPAQCASTDCPASGMVPWQLNSPASWKGCRTSTHAMCRIDVSWCARKHARLKFTFLFQVPSLFPSTFRFQPAGCQSNLYYQVVKLSKPQKELSWQSLSLATLRSSGVAITAMPNICHPASRWTVTLAMEIYILRPFAFDHQNGVLPC